jgi:hypothetical protein
MTEYELADLQESKKAVLLQQLSLMQSLGSDLQSLGQTARALLFGYVTVAYLIGAKLTPVQAGILSFFFIVWTSAIYSEGRMIVIGATKIYESTQQSAAELEIDLGSQWDSFIKYAKPYHSIFTLVLSLAALYFMWNVRHP